MNIGFQEGLLGVISALGLVVTYFLRLLHTELRQDIARLKEENQEMSTELRILKTKQTETDKSIEREIKHIREIIDTKLDKIEESLEKLLDKDEK